RAGAGKGIAPGVVLAAVVVIGAGVLIFSQRGGGGQQAQQASDGAAAVAGRVATGPFREGETLFSRLGAMWNATARIEELERENTELRVWRDLAERLAERNARYESLLRMPPDAMGEGADIEHAIAAQLVLDSGGPFTRTLVANAGADHGVRVGFIAVNENGLVGRVVSVGRRSARVLMLDDYTSRIPVMGEASRVRAVMAGQATRPPELITRPFQMQAPPLDFIVGAQSLRDGERMITSGDGGLYPRGIPVGVARRGGDGQWRVTLAASQQPIDFVRLLPYVGIEHPEAAPAGEGEVPVAGQSSVTVIRRETMAPAPIIALPQQRPAAQPASAPAVEQPAPPRPRPQPQPTPAAPQTTQPAVESPREPYRPPEEREQTPAPQPTGEPTQ
ncbi:MAG: rod shape-determining protein MreC, partial [Hyphomonadaceae bacterium]|nr:rod shape-determining protein MreC [Hyphomonadaceae bacterium]